MTGAEPSCGPGRGCASADAPAAEATNETKEQRACRNARQRRYLDRKILRQAVGRFLVTEDLVTALVATGSIKESEAATITGIEEGVASVLARFARDHGR